MGERTWFSVGGGVASLTAAVFFAALLFPQVASAAGPWKGDAFVSRDNAGLGTRNFALRTVNDQSAATDRASWELNGGESITVFFKTWTTDVPPDAATNVILRVYSDNGSTQVIELANGAPPADGTSYTFFATTTGLSGGTARAGTYRLYVQATCTGALACPLGTYDINSDSNGDKGALRAGVVVSDIAKNAYPAGSTYAYGTAGDETMTFTASTTERAEDTGTNQTVRLNTRRNGGAVIENGSTQEPGSGGSTAADFTADNTYDPGSGISYDVEYEVVGVSALLTGEKWTHIATSGNGADITRDSATVARYANRFVVDPRIYFSTNGTTANNDATPTFAVYNRGEIATTTLYLLNSRTEKLSRSMNISVVNAGSSVESGPTSVSPSSNVYTFAYTVGATDTSAQDDTGSMKKLRATNTDQTKDSNNVFGVSSLYYVDAHPQITTTLSKDDWPTEDANETTSAVISADIFSFFAHVKNVRKDTNIDTSGSAVLFTLKKPDASTRDTQASDTGSDGWTAAYDFAPEPPGGSWTITASSTMSGNSGIDTETLTFISPYVGNYALQAVGWNQTYSIGDTARFTVRTMERDDDGIFQAAAADSAPTYRISYWDGATWQELVSTASMTALGAAATYESTYAIPNDSAWIGRKVVVTFSATMSGTKLPLVQEIEIVGSPAQVLINDVTDTTVPTISADVRITNEGTAAFEYTYEWCVVTTEVNECGGGNDVAYGSAAKLIQPGADFDTTLTLNVTDTGAYYFKVAVWWSNQSSKASRTFTATGASSGGAETPALGGGPGAVNAPIPAAPEPPSPPSAPPPPAAEPAGIDLAALWEKVADILLRLLGLEHRVSVLEGKVSVLEEVRVAPPAPPPPPPPRTRREIAVPAAPPPQPPPVQPVQASPPRVFRFFLR